MTAMMCPTCGCRANRIGEVHECENPRCGFAFTALQARAMWAREVAEYNAAGSFAVVREAVIA